jgi:hypothetical protein
VPAIGRPLDFVHLEVKVAPSATEDLPLRFEDGLSTPPIVNLFAVDNQPVPVTELGGGTVRLGSSGGGAVFVRGDCNSDSKVDVSDPIIVLSSIFTGQERLLCEVAADANDDDDVDVSDPIYLLQYLFVHGAAPPPPDVGGGVDPTAGRLGCALPLR